jgi:hypothetical protein
VIEVTAPDGHVWLRLARPHYDDPFDTSYAQAHGGRWNPPGSWPTLYLNEDLTTVHAQVQRLFLGRGVEPEDLDDDAPIQLAAARLPRSQRVAEVISDAGVQAVGLPPTYPLGADGELVGYEVTRPIGTHVHDAGLRGVWCRSAALAGNELAWFPAPAARARSVWSAPRPYGVWRYARSLDDVG